MTQSAALRLFRRQALLHIRFYGKPGCHLCDEAMVSIMRLQRRRTVELMEIDITSDPKLFRLYDIRIPVVDIDGIVELDPPITDQRLNRAVCYADRVLDSRP